MILVLLGTQDKPFERILKEVSKLKKEGYIKDRIVAQTGYTKFNSKDMECFDFVSKDEIEKLIDDARLVIAHGGVGLITECLNKDKKVIVVPRLKKYKEHTNDHQMQIVKEFSANHHIIPLYDEKNLKGALDEAKTFKPNKYEPNGDKFREKIKQYIDE